MKRLALTLAILLAFAFSGVAQQVSFDFEDGTLQGWTTLDGDGDGHCWEPSIGGMGHNSNGMVMAYSKDYATGEPLTPNEFLVSPRLVLKEDWSEINFYVCALDEIYCAEHFGVDISTTVNDDPLAFTLLSEWTLTAKDAGNRQGNWYEFTVDLSAYAGQEVYVAIRHHYCSGQSAICVDDIEIYGEIAVAQDNSHYVDAVQICADGVTQFPLTVGFENSEAGPDYYCLYIQPNPEWFFVKMEEPGDVVLQINAESDGNPLDVDFCCWGPFGALPESSEALTRDKVVDCSYDTSPATCTIPSTAQAGEYFVLLVTNYVNLPGDLTFAIGGGTGSFECPGTLQSEWYYEIENENGSITYQYLYQAGDTIVNDEPSHILVKINTLYDKDAHTEVTHEYVFERDDKLYWWNKDLEEFTVLYDFGAEVGDSWEIKVGTATLDMHVDAVETIEYEGHTFRMLRVSDADDYFSGDIVCGIGHLTSFFPERLMEHGDGVRVEGLRCYWAKDELVFKLGDEDCDAIYEDLHGVEENAENQFDVYPNPTHNILFVETRFIASQPATYRVTNLMGQTLMTGRITARNQQIEVSALPNGMYFITVGDATRKFVVR